jgi:hypothetical protein
MGGPSPLGQQTPHHKTRYLLRNTKHSLETGRIVRYNLNTGKWIWDLIHNLYSSPDIIRQIKSRRWRWAENVTRMGKELKVYKVLVWKSDRRRPLGKPKRRWEVGSELISGRYSGGMDWIRLAQDTNRCDPLWMRWSTFGFLRHWYSLPLWARMALRASFSSLPRKEWLYRREREETDQSHSDQATGWMSRVWFQVKQNFSLCHKFRVSSGAHITFYRICTAFRP